MSQIQSSQVKVLEKFNRYVQLHRRGLSVFFSLDVKH